MVAGVSGEIPCPRCAAGSRFLLRPRDRMGEVLDFPGVDGTVHQARIVDPVFYDKDGEKQNV